MKYGYNLLTGRQTDRQTDRVESVLFVNNFFIDKSLADGVVTGVAALFAYQKTEVEDMKLTNDPLTLGAQISAPISRLQVLAGGRFGIYIE